MRCLTGIDRLAAGLKHNSIIGRRLGVITNPTGLTSDFRSSIEIIAGLPESELTALFACEHGLRGELQAGKHVDDEVDPIFGVPVYSLYGATRKPDAAMLEKIDTLIFDIQDLGVRFYTYMTTLLYAMEACAEHGKSLIVLDRPNPLGGNRVEGGLLEPGYESMVGGWQIPISTGMTIGEYARMANDLRGTCCDLDVIGLEGWSRAMDYADTGLPWMLPSPNIPTLDTVRLYSGTCFFEGTNLSEGRGTTRPFEWIGAPWIDGEALAKAFNAYRLPGIHAHSVYMTPTFSKHQGVSCGGVMLFVTDSAKLEAVRAGLVLLHLVSRMYPDSFQWLTPPEGRNRYFIDLLTGSDDVRKHIHEEEGLRRITEQWENDTDRWRTMRAPYLLYGEA
ncbi:MULTISPECIES: DUF1343 domain-containing protein [Paenibacillus]|uniref:Uncharacterized conserved protein UCP016719 n=1 Tax=Paenibacillus lactis 154 TaxID=743719 RepID=G4HKT1_9BACL|nr:MULTISPECIES: DUF1343 domain-containing protein [Paenibacillus]EHB59621.1 Uncharacterized conserved protein UCP016719 [Paenibacillus lactis 154]MCM3496616.1 DUF1343 domain-containing protein [Paenibacillus lactis]GIO94287.1 hypothetical protein J31TS3_55140 [Paenibacillus lactis]